LRRPVDPGDDTASIAASVRLDIDGRIRDASATAAAMLGYDPMALNGRTLTDLAAQGWRDAAELASARVRFGTARDFALLLRGRSGRLSLIEMAARPLETDGQAKAFVLEWANGRPRRQAEHGAVQAELHSLAVSLIRRREGERLNVAKRLHDDLMPTLAMAKYLVEDAAKRSARDETTELLGQAAASLRHVIKELRNISDALRPRLLDDLGLLPTLEWYGRGFEESYSPISVVRVLTATERNVPDHLKVDIFRIVQDALGNVAQHSQATVVRLSLHEKDDELRLAIEDNGKGFDTELALRSSDTSVGLLSIGRRVRATAGRFVLESRPGRGTRVTAAWPLGVTMRVVENGDPSYYPKSAVGAQIRG
jgi:two-component system NarL family sensor kinase